MRLSYYIASSGANPVGRYLDGLQPAERATVDAAFLQVARAARLEDTSVSFRPIFGKLWELRISRQRVFYVLVEGPEIVLLHAYRKQSQRAPRVELETAERRMREVLGR